MKIIKINIKQLKQLKKQMKIKNLLKPDNWWILILSGVIAYMLFMIYSEPEYNKAFNFILPGLTITFLSTFISFIIALFLGLISGIGRISKNKYARTISRTYIEFIRGVPVLILIFTIAFVVVVRAAEFFNINKEFLVLEVLERKGLYVVTRIFD